MGESKRQQWITKVQSNKNMVWIDHNMNKNIKVVALHIWDMYDDDFHLSIADICNILLCDRKWVVNNVKDNVKHIFLNEFIRGIMMTQCEREDILKDYYYFSESDFFRWLKQNTIAERQTISVDIGKFSKNPLELKRILTSYDKALTECKTNIAKGLVNIEYYSLINETLNSDGRMLFSAKANPFKRDIKYVKVPLELPKKFTSLKELKKQYSTGRPVNHEIIYRKLYKQGAVRYTIVNKKRLKEDGVETRLVRFDSMCLKNPEGLYDITVPYKTFLRIGDSHLYK